MVERVLAAEVAYLVETNKQTMRESFDSLPALREALAALHAEGLDGGFALRHGFRRAAPCR